MIFEVEDDDLREITQLAKGMLRNEYYKWATWCGLKADYDGWVQDQISMGIAVAYNQIDKWDQIQHPSFTRWACWKVKDQARESLRKLTRRKQKQPEVDEAIIEELMNREPIDRFETCIRQDSLKGVVKYLNPIMQVVIALYYLGGLTDLEISQFLKMNLSTVQSARQRALDRAREYYVILHSAKTPGSPPPAPPRTRTRKPRDSTEGEEPPSVAIPTKRSLRQQENGEQR